MPVMIGSRVAPSGPQAWDFATLAASHVTDELQLSVPTNQMVLPALTWPIKAAIAAPSRQLDSGSLQAVTESRFIGTLTPGPQARRFPASLYFLQTHSHAILLCLLFCILSVPLQEQLVKVAAVTSEPHPSLPLADFNLSLEQLRSLGSMLQPFARLRCLSIANNQLSSLQGA